MERRVQINQDRHRRLTDEQSAGLFVVKEFI